MKKNEEWMKNERLWRYVKYNVYEKVYEKDQVILLN
jgi:hypothetical protein